MIDIETDGIPVVYENKYTGEKCTIEWAVTDGQPLSAIYGLSDGTRWPATQFEMCWRKAEHESGEAT